MGLTRDEALKIMGLDEGCTTKEIRDRFKKLALRWHPDKNIDNPEEAQKKFQAISAAYTKLINADDDEDDNSTDYLREMFADIWRQSQNRGFFASDPHLFCDCDVCLADWEDISLEDFLYSDSDDPENDFYFDDCSYADDLLRRFGDKLYRKFNEPARPERKARQTWTGSGYRESVTAEEASRNAEELLRAEEREKRAAEKKKKRNRKRKESKKRRKTKPQEDGSVEGTPPTEEVAADSAGDEEEEEGEEKPRENTGDHTSSETVKSKVVEDRKYNDKKGSSGEPRAAAAAASVNDAESDVGERRRDRDSEDEEEREDSLPSEDELDYTSAFLSHAKMAATRAPSKAKKKPSTTETQQQQQQKQQQEAQKKTAAVNKQHQPQQQLLQQQQQQQQQQKSEVRVDSGHTESKFQRGRPRNWQKPQSKNTRTVNRGPTHSKTVVTMGINGSTPVISARNGHEAPGATAVTVEEEEDDLSPIDMSQASLFVANVPESKLLAGEGNRAAKAGEFEEAVFKYSEAIRLYPFDHRYFGNRSFCYDYLQEFAKALADANQALRIEANWAKGFYRRGRGLAGLKRYEAAVEAFTRALDLNPEYAEAREQLDIVQLEQLQMMGFPLEASKAALSQYHTVQAAVDVMVNKTAAGGASASARGKKHRSEYTPVYNHSGFEIPPRMLPQTAPPKNCSLWIGNVTTHSLTESVLTDLFQRYGEVLSVRVLYQRRCAFVNYSRPESAATALKKLQGHSVCGCNLLLRYPENTALHPNSQSSTSAPARTRRGKPISSSSTEECFFWRTTGCSYGNQCRFLHLPDSRGVDSGNHGDHQ